MNTNNVPNFDLEYSEATGEANKAPDIASTDATQIPEKYRGKSVEDIIKMHQEAEKLASRVGNDLAEQRRLTDVLLDLKKNDNAKVPEKKPITTDELFQDPNKAIEQAIQNSKPIESVKAAEDRINALEARLGQKEFEAKFPTYKEDVADPAFREWIMKNPARVALAQNADRLDFQAAGALWDMWAEHKSLAGTVQQVADVQNDRQERIQAAKTVRAAAGETGRSEPVYSRAKLMDLRVRAASGDPVARSKINDPDFQRELAKAYQDGRVR